MATAAGSAKGVECPKYTQMLAQLDLAAALMRILPPSASVTRQFVTSCEVLKLKRHHCKAELEKDWDQTVHRCGKNVPLLTWSHRHYKFSVGVNGLFLYEWFISQFVSLFFVLGVQFVSLFFCSRCAGRWHERPSLTTTISSQIPLYLPSKCRVLVSHSTGEVSTRAVYCCLSSVFIHLMLPICSNPRIYPDRFCSRLQVHTECECPRSHEHRFHQLCEQRHKRQERDTRVEQHHLQRRCCCSWPRKWHPGASRQRALTCICVCVCASTSKSVSYPLESHTWICECELLYLWLCGCVCT